MLPAVDFCQHASEQGFSGTENKKSDNGWAKAGSSGARSGVVVVTARLFLRVLVLDLRCCCMFVLACGRWERCIERTIRLLSLGDAHICRQ